MVCVSGQQCLALCFTNSAQPPPFPSVLLNSIPQPLVWLCRGPVGTWQAGMEAQCGHIQPHWCKGRLNAATISTHSLCPSLRQPAPPPRVSAQNQPAVMFTTYASVTPCKSMPGSLRAEVAGLGKPATGSGCRARCAQSSRSWARHLLREGAPAQWGACCRSQTESVCVIPPPLLPGTPVSAPSLWHRPMGEGMLPAWLESLCC